METKNRLRGIKAVEYYKDSDGLIHPKFGGVAHMSDENQNKVVEVSPTGAPRVNQTVVLVLTVLATIAACITAVGAAVPGVPPAVTTIAASVTAIASAFGIVSPGLRKVEK